MQIVLLKVICWKRIVQKWKWLSICDNKFYFYLNENTITVNECQRKVLFIFRWFWMSDIMILNAPRRPRIELPPITICDEFVSKSDSTTLLGVDVDSTLSLKNHVKNTRKCCFYKLHNLFKIRRFLSEDAVKTMVHTLITSKLDYCNSILNGL